MHAQHTHAHTCTSVSEGPLAHCTCTIICLRQRRRWMDMDMDVRTCSNVAVMSLRVLFDTRRVNPRRTSEIIIRENHNMLMRKNPIHLSTCEHLVLPNFVNYYQKSSAVQHCAIMSPASIDDNAHATDGMLPFIPHAHARTPDARTSYTSIGNSRVPNRASANVDSTTIRTCLANRYNVTHMPQNHAAPGAVKLAFAE